MIQDSGVQGRPKINKSELRELMRPIGAWMKEEKMVQQPVITKEEFKETFSKWLTEYHETNGGYIADSKQQLKMLKKYKITDQKNGLLDGFRNKRDPHDRLVINCEYLKETVSRFDVHGKEDDDEDSTGHAKMSVDSSGLNPDAKSVSFCSLCLLFLSL